MFAHSRSYGYSIRFLYADLKTPYLRALEARNLGIAHYTEYIPKQNIHLSTSSRGTPSNSRRVILRLKTLGARLDSKERINANYNV